MIHPHVTAEFQKRPLTEDDVARLRAGNVWNGKGPVGPDRLNHLTLTHVNFAGQVQQGEMMVMDVAADATLAVFKNLYDQQFPIHTIALMSEFGGNDDIAMSRNASNAFVSRAIAGGTRISIHAYGLAIDVNQIQNPYLAYDGEPGQNMILHPKESSMGYLNRLPDRPGKPPRPGMVEPIVSVFRDNGFTIWGGDWDDPLDYHHFQTSRPLAELLASTDYDTGQRIFDTHIAYYRTYKTDLLDALAHKGIDITNADEVALQNDILLSRTTKDIRVS